MISLLTYGCSYSFFYISRLFSLPSTVFPVLSFKMRSPNFGLNSLEVNQQHDVTYSVHYLFAYGDGMCVCVCLYSSTCWFLPAARRL